MVHLQFMVASALLKNTVSIEEWKHCTPEKRFPAIKYSNLQGKKVVFGTIYFGSQSFL